MHPDICKWPNLYFYKNELLSDPCTTQFNLRIHPFSILSLSYLQNKGADGQIENKMEAQFVKNLVKALDKYLPSTQYSFGIITPYSYHRKTLESLIR